MSSLNRGNYFKDRNNFYNALKAYLEAIKNDQKSISGHFNSIGVYIELGLFYVALEQSEIALRNFIRGDSDNLVEGFKLYSARAWMKMQFELYDSMNEDIQKCAALKKAPHLNSVKSQSIYLVKSLKDIELNTYLEEVHRQYYQMDSFSFIAFDDIGDFKRDLHFFMCKMYEAMGNLEKAIIEVNTAIKINNSVLSYQYKLGELLYKSDRKFEANRIYDDLSRKKKGFLPYQINQFQDGIITKTNRRGTKGTILTQTVFSGWDNIDFVNTIPLDTKLLVGDRKGIARNIKKSLSIHPKKLNYNTTFHCLINSTHNINNNINQCYFVYAFYPESFLLSFSMVSDKISEENMKTLESKGFLFIEIEFNMQTNPISIVETRLIPENNQYNFVPPPKPPKRIGGYKKESSGRICRVCHMDEWCGTDGCPMDPQ
jgi:tetratricopeptide (TPR) repeat protein